MAGAPLVKQCSTAGSCGVRLAHDVVCACALCRNPDKVARVSQQISAAADGGKISSYTYDMSSFADVREFAAAVKADHFAIDVLINNAGMFSKQKASSKDNIEMTWAVNALAPFLLTSLLLNTVKDRIVNVGSMALASNMDFDNLQQVTSSSVPHGL